MWQTEGLSFVVGKRWFYRQAEFGALPMIYGTTVVAFIAIIVAAPVGIGAAIFTSEFAPSRIRVFLKVSIELLAGIPSVVYGLLGILLLRDWIYSLLSSFDVLSGDTLLTAALLLSIMILPTIMTLSDDALRGVPRAHRISARGLGLTSTESVLSVVLPQARSGIIAAILLAFGRALGETIAVFLVVGRQDNQWPSNPFSLRPLMQAGQTLTSKLGGSETNIAYSDPMHWAGIVGLALVLLAFAATISMVGIWIGRKKDSRA